jgi:uncharacterized protein YjbJ (UPF0337 family)
MDENRVIGSTKAIKGAVKEETGKAIGDTKLQADGNADSGREGAERHRRRE